jgi:hypothetical protein
VNRDFDFWTTLNNKLLQKKGAAISGRLAASDTSVLSLINRALFRNCQTNKNYAFWL